MLVSTTTHHVHTSDNGFNRMTYSYTRVLEAPTTSVAPSAADNRAHQLMKMLHK